MAWFRPMGADEVAYHEATVLGRADDHPGRALEYYGSRGETPLRRCGTGAARLGLSGEVTVRGMGGRSGRAGSVTPKPVTAWWRPAVRGSGWWWGPTSRWRCWGWLVGRR